MHLKSRIGVPSTLLAALLAVSACTGPKGDTGPAGTNGTNGTSCTVATSSDGKSKTFTCTDGTSATVANGTDGTNGTNGTSCTVANNGNGTRTITCGDGSTITVFDAVIDYNAMTADEKASAAMSAVVTGVTVPEDGRPVVNLKVSDRHGYGVKGLAELAADSTTALAVSWRVGLLKLAAGVNGSANDTWVSYMAANDHSSASTETGAKANLTDNGDGTYAYKFTKVINAGADKAGTTYEAEKVHRLVVLLYASGNPFTPINIVKDFVPSTGADVTGQNEKVDPAACFECHNTFRAIAGGTGALGTGEFHRGSRYDIRACVACHNDQQRFDSKGATYAEPTMTSNGTWTTELHVLNGEAYINMPVLIHKIHMGEELAMKGGPYWKLNPYETTYPQDVRNCTKCHRSAAMADNWKTKPSRRACGACHDGKSFLSTLPPARAEHGTGGIGGAQATDANCTTCHSDTAIPSYHQPVVNPDTGSAWHVASGNSRTNAAYVAAANFVPKGAKEIKYDVKSVSAVKVDGNWQPQIVFRFLERDPSVTTDWSAVSFQTYEAGTTTEMMPGFAGSPSIYFAFAVPQDGITTPADFNATASAYLKSLWNGSASSAGTLTGPESGYYTVQLKTSIPPDATMLTGGIGYNYDLASTPPLVQTNVTGYPYTKNDATGKYVGGLIVPTPNVAVAATGCGSNGPPTAFCTPRRAIVETSRCNACHASLGVTPNFHVGQRNDAPTCSFCHNPNRTSAAWSANTKDFVHAIHGAAKRAEKFTWHKKSDTDGYWLVTYPAVLNKCEMCHLKGTYDFSATASAAAVPNLLYTTAAAGTFAAGSAHSSHVTEGNDYGGVFSVSNITSGTSHGTACSKAEPCVCTPAAPCTADATTLVTSPIVAACSACHDSASAIIHMRGEGGSFFEARTSALAKPEQCLMCHGPGTIADIGARHAVKP